MQAGLRRIDLANRLAVSEETIRLWERGAVQPSEEHLVRLIPMLSIEAASWSNSPRHRDDEMPALARTLRDERARRGLTQAAMAALLAAPQATYAGWETGRSTPSAQYTGAIAELLGLRVEAVEELSDASFDVDYDRWPPFGRLLGERRQALRLTRSAVAEALGVSTRTVANWELGHRRPARTQLVALAEVIGVSVADLIDRLPRPRSHTRLGELIASRQLELGLRSSDVARIVGTTEPTVSRWINGRSRPSQGNIERLALALRVPLPRIVNALEGAS